MNSIETIPGIDRSMTPEEEQKLDEYGRMAKQWCREGMTECETKWNADGKVFEWLSIEPDWAEGAVCWFWLTDPETPCKRIFRFSLIGGGQLTVSQRFEARYDRINSETVICHIVDDRVAITAHTPDRVHRYHGHICSYYSDCAASAVVCSGNADPEIVRRAAATLRAIGPQEEVFYALLDSSTGCALCNRPLRDEISKLVGVGPDCARHHGIPHNKEAASRRLKLRRELLGEGAIQ